MRRRVFKVLGPSDLEIDVDPVASEVLAAPVEKEDELLYAFAEARGDETVLKTAAMAARSIGALREAYGGELPIEVRKALSHIAGVDEPEPEPLRKTAPATPALRAPATPRSSDEILADATEFAKTGERDRDATAGELLAKLAENRRRRDPSLTREQAFAKALEAHPELYEGSRRHTLRQARALHDSPDELRKQRDDQRRLEEAADAVLAREPHLSREQATARALAENPDLYPEMP